MLSSNLQRRGYYLLCLAMVACNFKPSTTLDTTKVDTAYFVGEYEANYESETEKLILKENMHYDYIHIQKKDTIIDAGKWFYDNNNWATISITNFPNNIRKNKILLSDKETTGVGFSVNTYSEEMGDLTILVNGGEDKYTFVKLDKEKNQHYIKK